MTINDTTLMLLFVSVLFCILNCSILLTRISSLKDKVSELETLVDYIYELRHIPISEARLNKSAKELVDYANLVIDRENG